MSASQYPRSPGPMDPAYGSGDYNEDSQQRRGAPSRPVELSQPSIATSPRDIMRLPPVVPLPYPPQPGMMMQQQQYAYYTNPTANGLYPNGPYPVDGGAYGNNYNTGGAYPNDGVYANNNNNNYYYNPYGTNKVAAPFVSETALAASDEVGSWKDESDQRPLFENQARGAPAKQNKKKQSLFLSTIDRRRRRDKNGYSTIRVGATIAQGADGPQEEGAKSQRQRRCCFCLPATLPYKLLIIIIVFIVLVMLAVIGYFYFPRMPMIRVLNLEVGDVNMNAITVSTPPGATNLDQLTVSIKLSMLISTFNPNLYDMKVDSINLEAFLAVNTTQIQLRGTQPSSIPQLVAAIGTGPANRDPNYVPNYNPLIGSGNKSTITFPSKKNVTFSMDFTVLYTPDPRLGLINDPAFSELMQVCGLTTRARPARINYHSVSTVNLLSKFGYSPTLDDHILIRCPISQDAILAIAAAGVSGQGLNPTSLTNAVNGMPIMPNTTAMMGGG